MSRSETEESAWRVWRESRGERWRLGLPQPVWDCGDLAGERAALVGSVGLLDLGCRGRLCLTGRDRVEFLHGQVTNTVKGLAVGRGCYAALVNAKGRVQSDLRLHVLADEILLDFEPGLASRVAGRLQNYIIADDVQVVDVSPHYGLLSVQGPQAGRALAAWGWAGAMPARAFDIALWHAEGLGDLYLANVPRIAQGGFDLYIPISAQAQVETALGQTVLRCGGRRCGWDAWEAVRIEQGIPRFGADIEERHLAPEAAMDARWISYTKGCYIGQEVIARIRTYGRVAKTLRSLRVLAAGDRPPRHGDKLAWEGRPAGELTSWVPGPVSGEYAALGYVRKECCTVGTVLGLASDPSVRAEVAALPWGG